MPEDARKPTPEPPIAKTAEQALIQSQIKRLLAFALGALTVFPLLQLADFLWPTNPIATGAGLLAFPCSLSVVVFGVAESLCGLLTLDGGVEAIWPSTEFWASLASGLVFAWMTHLSVRVRNRAEWDGLLAAAAATE